MPPVAGLAVAPIYLPLPGSDAPHLARVAYGREVAGAVLVPARQLGAAELVETWPRHPDLIFGSVSVSATGDLERTSREVYARVIAEARAAGHPHFVRMWNYVGSINEADGGRERYQLFCAGRHEAFDDAGIAPAELPAASAVGVPGRGLVTYYLAARTPGAQVENPRQMSAYCYPPRYGPKSPSFARATLWEGTLFVSGTSSVVGHESVHVGDVAEQLEETLRNIERVVARALPGGTLANVVAAKTYVRSARDYAAIARRLDMVFAANLVLEADICRADLLLEIEAVAVAR